MRILASVATAILLSLAPMLAGATTIPSITPLDYGLKVSGGYWAGNAGATFGEDPPASVIVIHGGLEWIWAAPCATEEPSCGTPTPHHGFRIPTDAEWTSWLTLADLVDAFTGPELCGSPWMSSHHSHCDAGDLEIGGVWHGFGICAPGLCNHSNSESFLVRGERVPGPATLALVLSGLGAAAWMSRRRVRWLNPGKTKKTIIGGLAAWLLLFIAAGAGAAPINQVPYASLTGTEVVTFDDVPGGPAPGTNYDGIFVSGGAGFAERFAGQTRSTSGNFDVLSGAPSASLSLALGLANQNLNIFIEGSSQVLTGLGPLGFPNFDAIGEGSFAVLFSTDQSEFGFQLVGGNRGTATVDFFRRDGSLIDEIVLTDLTSAFYGFSREGGLKDIAGISIYNNDPAGIGFDNLKHDVASDVPPPGVPGPASALLVGLGLLVLGFARRKLHRA